MFNSKEIAKLRAEVNYLRYLINACCYVEVKEEIKTATDPKIRVPVSTVVGELLNSAGLEVKQNKIYEVVKKPNGK